MTDNTKRIRVLGAVALGVALMAIAWSASATWIQGSESVASGPTNLICTEGPTFELRATEGYILVPDGNSIYMWSYSPVDGGFQVPSPVLCVSEGDAVTVTLTNELAEPVSIVFPGQTGVTSSGGVSGLMAREAPPGGQVSYHFTADKPGTFLYESGSKPHKQVEMGLYGAMIVRPALGPNYVYNDADTEFNPNWEYLVLMHDIDWEYHLAVQNGQVWDVTNRRDEYWTVNGRSMPDTIADHGVPWLPNQPYSALIQVEPYDPVTNTLPALLRFVNAGRENHPFHPHGNNVNFVGQDGRHLVGPGNENLTYQAFTKSFGSGQTYDALITWEDADGWATQGVTLPVEIPSLLNLFWVGDWFFYSGDAVLGQQGDLPVGVTTLNECGEYYFPWHSHALNEFQNFDEGFGGMATAWRINPPGGCP